MTPTRLRDVPTLDAFLRDLPFLFGGSIYAWFPAHVASCWEALILPNGDVAFSGEHYTFLCFVSRKSRSTPPPKFVVLLYLRLHRLRIL
jgi:hypothetical protein